MCEQTNTSRNPKEAQNFFVFIFSSASRRKTNESRVFRNRMQEVIVVNILIDCGGREGEKFTICVI